MQEELYLLIQKSTHTLTENKSKKHSQFSSSEGVTFYKVAVNAETLLLGQKC